MIDCVVAIDPKDEHREVFDALVDWHAGESLKEPGNVRFDVLRGHTKTVLCERFRDEEAIEAHRKTAHYRRWRDEIDQIQRVPRDRRVLFPILPEADFLWLSNTLTLGGATVAWTNGVFDLLGVHHVRMLEESSQQADYLFVGVNSDASVRSLKPGRPIRPMVERLEMITSLTCVDWAVGFCSESHLEDLIQKLCPDVLCKGAERVGESIPGAEFAGRVHFCQHNAEHSTSKTIARINSQVKCT